MTFVTLKRGDKGKDVELLQSQLNKVGAMLIVDGDFGLGTKNAVTYAQDIAGHPTNGVAEISLWNWLEIQPIPFELLETNGVAFIAKGKILGSGLES